MKLVSMALRVRGSFEIVSGSLFTGRFSVTATCRMWYLRILFGHARKQGENFGFESMLES